LAYFTACGKADATSNPDQRDLDDAFALIEQPGIGALLVSPDPFFFSERGSS
jgi:hypothetical protein